jgi:hypothetical protein
MSQKLKRASQFTFGELNLRQYFFEKWRFFKNIAMATETIDVALLVWGLRDALNEWKSLAWPRRFKSRRNLRELKKGFFRQSSTTLLERDGEEEEEGEFVEKKNEYMWPVQEQYGAPILSPDEIYPHSNEFYEHEEEEEDCENYIDEQHQHEQQQQQWQMAAFGSAGVSGSESELGSHQSQPQSQEGDLRSSTSKKSWFSSLLPKR